MAWVYGWIFPVWGDRMQVKDCDECYYHLIKHVGDDDYKPLAMVERSAYLKEKARAERAEAERDILARELTACQRERDSAKAQSIPQGEVMTDDEKAAERIDDAITKAAEKYCLIEGWDSRIPFCDGWDAGIAHARQNPGPEVLALVEALEQATMFSQCVSTRTMLTKALSQWRKARGEK